MSDLRLWQGHMLYIAVLAAYAAALPVLAWDPASKDYILLIGFIAIWRYTWWCINLARFLIYTKIRFPKWRRQAEEKGKEALPSEIYLLVTSFRIDTETTRLVYTSVINEAASFARKYDIPVVILGSIVERSDDVLIRELLRKSDLPENVRYVSVRIGGTGKRDALAYGFRAISSQRPAPDAVAAVIDGDSMLEENLIEKCACMFKLHPKLGALTTDELCEVQGHWKFREWYSMRFAQRHIYMSSVSLSKRVLTLTGRMSMFRADILTSPEFIERVEMDWIDHWRLGRFKFLTGDDKSSWYHILKEKYEMIYIPDVKVVTIETPPDPSFIKASITLMRRWFGNMLRTNGRAIRLGPKVMNFFPWISTIDQRISMWTALTGFTLTVLSTFTVTPLAPVYYIFWMLLTRYILALTLLLSRDRVSPVWPFFLYYNQLVGSFVKIYVFFRLDKQRWTRQKTTLKSDKTVWMQRFTNLGSFYIHLFSFSLFVVALGVFSGVLEIPDFYFWYNLTH
ncbi:MAG: glycosyltransferase [Alphaproteobacteria bacterium]